MGQVIWKMVRTASNNYSTTLFASPTTASPFLYEGETPSILIGDFANTSGKEVLVLNRFLDWSLFQSNGSPVLNGRRTRAHRIVGPTQSAIVNIDSDPTFELLVPAFDGHVWMLDPEDSPAGTMWPSTTQNPILPFTNLALYKVVPCFFAGNSTPTHLLLFGRNDSNVLTSKNVIQLWDFATKTLLLTKDADPDSVNSALTEAMSFIWIDAPVSTGALATFVIGTCKTLQKFTLSVSPPSITAIGSVDVFPRLTPLDDSREVTDCVSSLHAATLSGGSSLQPHVVMATSDGRIWVFDRNLSALRHSFKEVNPGLLPGSPTQTSWPSNRSLGRTFAFDFDRDTSNGSAHLYFAEYSQPLYLTSSGKERYRVGELVLTPGSSSWSSFTSSWGPYLADARNAAFQPANKNSNRSLLYRDLDLDGVREARAFCETGTAFFDSRLPVPAVREFMTSVAFAPFLWTAGLVNTPHGGHVFEVNSLPPTQNYYFLGGFSIPRDALLNYDDFRPGQPDWWYPKIGPNRLSGQIASYSQSSLNFHYGTAMKTVQLTKTGAALPSPHVLVGTNGGYLYAIEPGINTPSGSGPLQYERTSILSFASNDLGTVLMGLDAGQLITGAPSDPDPEIAVGTLLDTGDYVDWTSGNVSKNRGKLYVLDPQPAAGSGPGTFSVFELTADDLLLPGNGIGAGVTGVKIDDVDGNGSNEIWCGDAVGHLYLFKWDTGAIGSNRWRCIYRSKDLGCFPGIYNNIFPIKNSDPSHPDYNKTEKLLIVSAGYVVLFDLNRSLISLP